MSRVKGEGDDGWYSKLEEEVDRDCRNGGCVYDTEFGRGDGQCHVWDLARRFRALPRDAYEVQPFENLTFKNKFCYCLTMDTEWYSDVAATVPLLCAGAALAVRRRGIATWHLWWCLNFMHSVEEPQTHYEVLKTELRNARMASCDESDEIITQLQARIDALKRDGEYASVKQEMRYIMQRFCGEL